MSTELLREILRNRGPVFGGVLAFAIFAAAQSVTAGLAVLALFGVLFWSIVSASANRGYPLSKLLEDSRQEVARARHDTEVQEFLNRIAMVLGEGFRDQSRHDIRLIDRGIVGGEVSFLLDFGVNGWADIDRDKLLRHIRAVFPGRFSAIDFVDPGREDNTAILVLKGKRADHTATAQTAAW